MDEAKFDNPVAGEGRGAHENHGVREGWLAAHLRPLVVKIGSSTLTTSESKIDYAFLDDVARQVARVREAGLLAHHRDECGHRVRARGAWH